MDRLLYDIQPYLFLKRYLPDVLLSFLFGGDINSNPLKNTTAIHTTTMYGESLKNSPHVKGLSLKMIHLIISNNSTTIKSTRN
jgi:hypothetical protein